MKKVFSHTLALSALTTAMAMNAYAEVVIPEPEPILTLEEQVEKNKTNIQTNSDDIVTNVYLNYENSVGIEQNANDIANINSRINSLGNNSGGTTIDIDCATDSINSAIANAPAYGQLTLNIIGACTETVAITRSNTALVGIGSASIAYDAPLTTIPGYTSLTSTISILGAQNVVIDNLSVSGATSPPTSDLSGSAGITVKSTASAFIKDSTISGNFDGVIVSSASSARLSGNTIESNVRTALIVANSAHADLIGGNTLTQLTNATPDNRAYTVGIWRNGVVRTSGTNAITGSSSVTALSLYYNSVFRSYYGLVTVNGRSSVGDYSQLELRDGVYNGDIFTANNATVRLVNRAGQTQNEVTVNGDIYVRPLSVFSTSPNTSVSGYVNCSQNAHASISSGTVQGGVTNC